MHLALAAVASVVAADAGGLTFAHWNPHWQCFVESPACAAHATAALTSLLSSGGDFVNVVELETTKYEPPAGWASIAPFETCGPAKTGDWDTLFYNEKAWQLKQSKIGCVVDGRSFAAGVFQSRSDPALVLTVLGAHYPQTLNASTHAYLQAVGNLSAALKPLATERAVLLADTNTEGPAAAAASASHNGVNKTNAQILQDLGLWPAKSSAAPPAAPLFKGCCASDNFSWQGDRIVANFGTVVSSRTLFDPAPDWAVFSGSEFHKGVLLTLKP